MPASTNESLLFSSGVTPAKEASKRANDESNFFGIGNGRRNAKEVSEEDHTGNALWTENEPHRSVVWNLWNESMSNVLIVGFQWSSGVWNH